MVSLLHITKPLSHLWNSCWIFLLEPSFIVWPVVGVKEADSSSKHVVWVVLPLDGERLLPILSVMFSHSVREVSVRDPAAKKKRRVSVQTELKKNREKVHSDDSFSPDVEESFVDLSGDVKEDDSLGVRAGDVDKGRDSIGEGEGEDHSELRLELERSERVLVHLGPGEGGGDERVGVNLGVLLDKLQRGSDLLLVVSWHVVKVEGLGEVVGAVDLGVVAEVVLHEHGVLKDGAVEDDVVGGGAVGRDIEWSGVLIDVLLHFEQVGKRLRRVHLEVSIWLGHVPRCISWGGRQDVRKAGPHGGCVGRGGEEVVHLLELEVAHLGVEGPLDHWNFH